MINPCAQHPMTASDPVDDHGFELFTSSALQVPAPQFGRRAQTHDRSAGTQFRTTEARAGHPSRSPHPCLAPDDRPDPSHQARTSTGEPLRWARCPDGRLHLLASASVVAAATSGHAPALCGQTLPATALTLTASSASPLCLACVTGIPNPQPANAEDRAGRPLAQQPTSW